MSQIDDDFDDGPDDFCDDDFTSSAIRPQFVSGAWKYEADNLRCQLSNARKRIAELESGTFGERRELPSSIAHIPGLVRINMPPAIGPCIYFLISDGVVVYIGQSRHVSARIETHFREKVFDRVVALPVPDEEMNAVEAALIRHFKPRLNGLYVPRVDVSATLSSIGFVFGNGGA